MEPAWKAQKALLESYDDGHGPYMEWSLIPLPMTAAAPEYWEDFKVWANDNLGQGYSLACADGMLLDEVTSWAFTAYRAGRQHSAVKT
jgi:hypothetical protein